LKYVVNKELPPNPFEVLSGGLHLAKKKRSVTKLLLFQFFFLLCSSSLADPS